MRVLLTGAGGQLGTELSRRLAGRCRRLTAAPRSQLDITNPEQIAQAFAGGQFDLVVNAAAYTAVDRAEAEEAAALRINAEGPACLARACAARGAALIHFSTDYVFDGNGTAAFTECDPPCPINAYGRTKLQGEEAIRQTLYRHVIIRTAWLFGSAGSNFVKSILRLAAQRDELAVVADQQGNPTAAADLAWVVAELVEAIARGRDGFPWGTWHCVNRGAASWHEFARAIVEHAAPALGRRPTVRAVPAAEYPTAARRPQNSRLDCTKLQRTFGIVMPPWRRTLPHIIDEILSARASAGET